MIVFFLEISNDNKQKIFIFGHNLPTASARWPIIKGSKNEDFSQVYFK